MAFDPASIIGALVVAIPNTFFLVRWVNGIDKKFEDQEAKIEKAKEIAESGKHKARDLQRALEMRGCIKSGDCPMDDDDSAPPIITNLHKRRVV